MGRPGRPWGGGSSYAASLRGKTKSIPKPANGNKPDRRPSRRGPPLRLPSGRAAAYPPSPANRIDTPPRGGKTGLYGSSRRADGTALGSVAAFLRGDRPAPAGRRSVLPLPRLGGGRRPPEPHRPAHAR